LIRAAGAIFQVHSNRSRANYFAGGARGIVGRRTVAGFDVSRHRNLDGARNTTDARNHFLAGDALAVRISEGESDAGGSGGNRWEAYVLKDAGAYFTGPLARYNLNFDLLPGSVQDAAHEAGLGRVCRNPFQSIVVRSLEILYACEEALRIIQQYEPPERPAVELRVRAGAGYACTEAPRGTLYHRYRIDETGAILDAKIVPPTSQNQKAIEEDLRQFVTQYLDLPDEKLQWQCEQAVRNYDPCISCSTHFLKLTVERA
jgi:hypothetical protein